MRGSIFICPGNFSSFFDSNSDRVEREILNGNFISFSFGCGLGCWQLVGVRVLCEVKEATDDQDY